MGFRFRKSVKAGPFRLNFSKSGVGYSVGGKGFRLTKKSKWRFPYYRKGKIFLGVLYMFTGGLCLIGVVVDLIALLGKPNPYYV